MSTPTPTRDTRDDWTEDDLEWEQRWQWQGDEAVRVEAGVVVLTFEQWRQWWDARHEACRRAIELHDLRYLAAVRTKDWATVRRLSGRHGPIPVPDVGFPLVHPLLTRDEQDCWRERLARIEWADAAELAHEARRLGVAL